MALGTSEMERWMEQQLVACKVAWMRAKQQLRGPCDCETMTALAEVHLRLCINHNFQHNQPKH